MKPTRNIICALVVSAAAATPVHAQSPSPAQFAPLGQAEGNALEQLSPRAYLPIAIRPSASSCPQTSTNLYTPIAIDGGHYKNNALTDENADFRLSVLGYSQVDEPLVLVDYGGSTDPDAPRLHGVFEPNRVPAFVRVHRRFDWNWNEAAPPPYGARGGLNTDWPVSVLELGGTKGEAVRIPERSALVNRDGNGDYHAMVLYAGERELTLVYTRGDSVLGYVVHMLNFCVDPNLVSLYQAQLSNGKRATGRLPGVRNNQVVGTLLGDTLTVAVRDQGAFLDPRSRKDWWQGISTAEATAVQSPREHSVGDR